MKIKVNQETLCKALQKVTNIIGSRTTLPVLANVWMSAEDNKLTIATTDLEIRYTTSPPSLSRLCSSLTVATLSISKTVVFPSVVVLPVVFSFLETTTSSNATVR